MTNYIHLKNWHNYLTSNIKQFFSNILKSKEIKYYFKKSLIPELNELKKIIIEIRKFKPDLILAIGGGSVIDYAKIANEFKLLFIEKVPKMTNDYSDQCRRFISLIDMLYENKCSVVILAENPISSLCQITNLSKEFERTASRLYEMTLVQAAWKKNY